MCQAWIQIKRQERLEGKREGKLEGLQQGKLEGLQQGRDLERKQAHQFNINELKRMVNDGIIAPEQLVGYFGCTLEDLRS